MKTKPKFNKNIIVTGNINNDKNMNFKVDNYPLCDGTTLRFEVDRLKRVANS